MHSSPELRALGKSTLDVVLPLSLTDEEILRLHSRGYKLIDRAERREAKERLEQEEYED